MNDLVNPADLLKQQLATANTQVEQGESNKIKIDVANGFVAPDGTAGRNMEVIILDVRMVNQYYDTPYSANKYIPPACYANAKNRQDLIPVDESPIKQADSCAVCPQNKFGSGTGKAKACKNTRQLAVIPLTADVNTPVWVLSVPPSSVKKWDSYFLELVQDHSLTPLFAVTRITQPKNASYASPQFTFVKPLNDDEKQLAITRMSDAAEVLDRVPDFSDHPENANA